jgi:hypothetical protein
MIPAWPVIDRAVVGWSRTSVSTYSVYSTSYNQERDSGTTGHYNNNLRSLHKALLQRGTHKYLFK